MEIRQGEADIEQVMKDVMFAHQVEFQRSGYCDGLPVTLRFADGLGRF